MNEQDSQRAVPASLHMLLDAVAQERVATAQLVVTDTYRPGPIGQRSDHRLEDCVPVLDAVSLHPPLECLEPMVRDLDLYARRMETEDRIGAVLARVLVHLPEGTAACLPGIAPSAARLFVSPRPHAIISHGVGRPYGESWS